MAALPWLTGSGMHRKNSIFKHPFMEQTISVDERVILKDSIIPPADTILPCYHKDIVTNDRCEAVVALTNC